MDVIINNKMLYNVRDIFTFFYCLRPNLHKIGHKEESKYFLNIQFRGQLLYTFFICAAPAKPDRQTARLTTSHCVPSRWWLNMYMKNRDVYYVAPNVYEKK